MRGKKSSWARRGASFRLVAGRAAAAVSRPGRANVSNLLARACDRVERSAAITACVARLRSFPGVAGRMERVDAEQPFGWWWTAPTAGALRHALGELRRDAQPAHHGLRLRQAPRPRAAPAMTRAVRELADFAIATSDNPRSGASRILNDMRPGVTIPTASGGSGPPPLQIEMAFQLAPRPGDCASSPQRSHEATGELAEPSCPSTTGRSRANYRAARQPDHFTFEP